MNETRRLTITFSRTLATLGPALLVTVLAVDRSWIGHWGALFVLAVAAGVLRAFHLGIGKYSYATQLGIVLLAGALLFGPATTSVSVAVGLFATDWIWFRKDPRAALVNVSREIVALITAYGFYAAALRVSGVTSPRSYEAVFAITLFGLVYFLVSRAVFYYTLVIRNKLPPDERLFVLRYEVVAYGITLVGAGVAVLTVVSLPPIGWPFVAVPVLFVGSIIRRILEEAIQAEELNRLHAMELVITSNVSLEQALAGIEALAHQILDWRDYRIYRRQGDGLALLYRGTLGTPEGDDIPGFFDTLRTEAFHSRQTVGIHDAERDPRTVGLSGYVRSLVIIPLVFGDELIGTLELDHHKRRQYGGRRLGLVETCARRIATAIHIHDLRKPLLDTVGRINEQVTALGRLADELRSAADGMTASTEAIGGGLSQQDTEVASGLDATQELRSATQRVFDDSGDAARASNTASDLAERHRRTIGDAIERLITLKAFVAESSNKVGELGTASRRIVKFLTSIRELADLTQLLALNAAIEAARAGVHGRGFAEVAREVRSLAEQSVRTADDAAELVETMQARLTEVVEQMRRGEVAVGGVEELSTEGLQALETITSATIDATKFVQQIAETAQQQQDAFGRLRERINGVASISSRNREDADTVLNRAKDVAAGVEEMGQATRELNAIAVMLSKITTQVTSGDGSSGVDT
jgi:methyl-accepting chemotaxis protein